VEGKEQVIDVRLMQVLPTEEWNEDKIKEEQAEDPDLSIIIKFQEEGRRPIWSKIADASPVVKAYWTQWGSFDGQSKKSLIVVPKVRIEKFWRSTLEEPVVAI
jgi:hypothetical protein